MVTMDRKDGVNAIKLKEKQDYSYTENTKLIIDRQTNPLHFRDPINLQKFIENQTTKTK